MLHKLQRALYRRLHRQYGASETLMLANLVLSPAQMQEAAALSPAQKQLHLDLLRIHSIKLRPGTTADELLERIYQDLHTIYQPPQQTPELPKPDETPPSLYGKSDLS